MFFCEILKNTFFYRTPLAAAPSITFSHFHYHCVKSARILVRIFPDSDWIRIYTPNLSVFCPSAGKMRTRITNTDTFYAVYESDISAFHDWYKSWFSSFTDWLVSMDLNWIVILCGRWWKIICQYKIKWW